MGWFNFKYSATVQALMAGPKTKARVIKKPRGWQQWRELKGKKPLEKKLESYCCDYAVDVYAARHRKMNGMGKAHWPDRLFLLPGALSIWVEFKRIGEFLTPNQAELHKDFRSMGHEVYVCETVQEFVEVLRAIGTGKMDAKKASRFRGRVSAKPGRRRPAAGSWSRQNIY